VLLNWCEGGAIAERRLGCRHGEEVGKHGIGCVVTEPEVSVPLIRSTGIRNMPV
jgi:hypothetical protein